jgi:hypothetical protein
MVFALLLNTNVSGCQYKIYCSVYQFHFHCAMRLLCKELAAALCPLFLRVCAIKGLPEFCSGSDTCSLLLSIVITRRDFCNGLHLCRHQFSLRKTNRRIYVFIVLF